MSSARSKKQKESHNDNNDEKRHLLSPHVETRVSPVETAEESREKKKIDMQMYREPPEYREGM